MNKPASWRGWYNWGLGSLKQTDYTRHRPLTDPFTVERCCNHFRQWENMTWTSVFIIEAFWLRPDTVTGGHVFIVLVRVNSSYYFFLCISETISVTLKLPAQEDGGREKRSDIWLSLKSAITPGNQKIWCELPVKHQFLLLERCWLRFDYERKSVDSDRGSRWEVLRIAALFEKLRVQTVSNRQFIFIFIRHTSYLFFGAQRFQSEQR